MTRSITLLGCCVLVALVLVALVPTSSQAAPAIPFVVSRAGSPLAFNEVVDYGWIDFAERRATSFELLNQGPVALELLIDTRGQAFRASAERLRLDPGESTSFEVTTSGVGSPHARQLVTVAVAGHPSQRFHFHAQRTLGNPAAPRAPAAVFASEGEAPDRIFVSWRASTHASGYEVWRTAGENDPVRASLVAQNVEGTQFDDDQIAPGRLYYYFIRAVNQAGRGLPSDPTAQNGGYALDTSVPPLPPESVVGSRGTFVDHVEVQWTVSPSANAYEVWRSEEVNDPRRAVRVSRELSFTFRFEDFGTDPGTLYFYFVRGLRFREHGELSDARGDAANAGFIPGDPADPCGGKSCGDFCFVCPHDEPGCDLTATVCDFDRECVLWDFDRHPGLLCTDEDPADWPELESPPPFGPGEGDALYRYIDDVLAARGIVPPEVEASTEPLLKFHDGSNGCAGSGLRPGWRTRFDDACQRHGQCFDHGWDYDWTWITCDNELGAWTERICEDLLGNIEDPPGECGLSCQCSKASRAYSLGSSIFGTADFHVDPTHNPQGHTLPCAPETEAGSFDGVAAGFYPKIYQFQNVRKRIPFWDVEHAPDTYCGEWRLGGEVRGLYPVESIPPQAVTLLATVENDQEPDTLEVEADQGQFIFEELFLHAGTQYAVTLKEQPAGHECWIFSDGSGSGVMPAADVNVRIDCKDWYFVRAEVTGLPAGQSVELELATSRWDEMRLTAPFDQTWNFQVANANRRLLTNGDTYEVTVATQPDRGICDVSDGSGAVDDEGVQVLASGDVLVQVECGFRVGGEVRGLDSGESVVLQNNGGDELTVSQSGDFHFEAVYGAGDAYHVTVRTQPENQECEVTRGSGVLQDDVTDVVVDCGGSSHWLMIRHFKTATFNHSHELYQPNTSCADTSGSGYEAGHRIQHIQACGDGLGFFNVYMVALDRAVPSSAHTFADCNHKVIGLYQGRRPRSEILEKVWAQTLINERRRYKISRQPDGSGCDGKFSHARLPTVEPGPHPSPFVQEGRGEKRYASSWESFAAAPDEVVELLRLLYPSLELSAGETRYVTQEQGMTYGSNDFTVDWQGFAHPNSVHFFPAWETWTGSSVCMYGIAAGRIISCWDIVGEVPEGRETFQRMIVDVD